VPAVVRRGVSAVTDRFGAVMVRLGLRGRRRGARRRAVLVVTVTLLAAGVGAVAGTAPSVRGLLGLPAQARAALPGDVVLCDVGQGDAVVAVAESGRGVLLDAGPRDGDVGACLDRAGVGHLCAAVVSHLDADHVGGLTAALERAPADAVIYGTAGRRAPTRTAERGVTGRSVECAPWTVTVVRAPDAAEENDASLVVRAVTDVGEGIDLLTAGDAEEAAGTAAVADGVAEPSGDRTRLLKISHHGSANGGTDLMRSFLPEVALIGVGEDNDYGHPSPKILDALRARSVPVLRTDQDGTVLLRSTDQGLRVVRHE
jgi:competence protein ComEC